MLFEKDILMYTYDFGDDWKHAIVLEKILPPTESKVRAEYVTGKNACPPEDCGGVYGYANMLEMLKDSANEEYEDMRDWLCLADDEEYDPKHIALNKKYVDNKLNQM